MWNTDTERERGSARTHGDGGSEEEQTSDKTKCFSWNSFTWQFPCMCMYLCIQYSCSMQFDDVNHHMMEWNGRRLRFIHINSLIYIIRSQKSCWFLLFDSLCRSWAPGLSRSVSLAQIRIERKKSYQNTNYWWMEQMQAYKTQMAIKKAHAKRKNTNIQIKCNQFFYRSKMVEKLLVEIWDGILRRNSSLDASFNGGELMVCSVRCFREIQFEFLIESEEWRLENGFCTNILDATIHVLRHRYWCIWLQDVTYNTHCRIISNVETVQWIEWSVPLASFELHCVM